MSENQEKYLKTKAYVLHRTNYGESDRILNLITPEGKISVLAKGVRKEKSKLAGGIEPFCLSEIVVHNGKSDLKTLTGAKMLHFYQNLLSDLDKMSLAALILKKISTISEQKSSAVFFNIVDQTLPALNAGLNPNLVETWFWLNFVKASGGEINLYRDTLGEKLSPEKVYLWDANEEALKPHPAGNISANEIKFLRLAVSADLNILARIKNFEPLLPAALHIAKSVSQN